MNTFQSKQYLDIGTSESNFYFPSYLYKPAVFHYSILKQCWLTLIWWFLRAIVWIGLRPRRGSVGILDSEEVNKVYDREAAHYDWKHHLTTRGQDTTWRRFAGWQITAIVTKHPTPLEVLDLCTGTGLTAMEIANVFSRHSVAARIIGIDRNKKMLGQAYVRENKYNGVTVQFAHGDATSLIESPDNTQTNLARFDPATFDAVTQVFGIGGIKEPLSVFENVLSVLKEGGQFILVDMHVPIASQPGEYPMFFKWLRTPLLEAVTYHQITIPLVLNRLWGWRDPTLDFYLLPLVTWQDKENNWWGYEIVSRIVESERWWLALPIMPVARIVCRKIQLTQSMVQIRRSLLQKVHNYP